VESLRCRTLRRRALVFFCCALVLVTLIPAIERAFAGLDRVVGIAVVLTGSLKREAERDRV
jgi:hypothetical protein